YSSCNLKGFYVPDECSSPTYKDRRSNCFGSRAYGHLTPSKDPSPLYLTHNVLDNSLTVETEQTKMPPFARFGRNDCNFKDCDNSTFPIRQHTSDNHCSSLVVDIKREDVNNFAETTPNEPVKQRKTFNLKDAQALLAVSLGTASVNAIEASYSLQVCAAPNF